MVFLQVRRADSMKRQSFCEIRRRICPNDGRFGESARGFGQTTVFLRNRRAGMAKRPSFREIGARNCQNDRRLPATAAQPGKTATIAN